MNIKYKKSNSSRRHQTDGLDTSMSVLCQYSSQVRYEHTEWLNTPVYSTVHRWDTSTRNDCEHTCIQYSSQVRYEHTEWLWTHLHTIQLTGETRAHGMIEHTCIQYSSQVRYEHTEWLSGRIWNMLYKHGHLIYAGILTVWKRFKEEQLNWWKVFTKYLMNKD